MIKSLLNQSILCISLAIVFSSCGSEASNTRANSTSVDQESSAEMTNSSNDLAVSNNSDKQVEAAFQSSVSIMKIADVVANAKNLEGKEVTIQGEITKVNSRIMGRNWIHLKDGSKDDYDLVVTSKEVMNIGENVTLTCLVALNKDFGAGYTYDLILEDARSVK